jgi:hypothetical protein
MADFARPYDALVANDVDGALAWYEKRRAGVMGQPVPLHNWTRLMCSVGRREEASVQLNALIAMDEYAVFAAGQRLILAMEKGAAPEEALRVTDLGAAERHRDVIARCLAEFDITADPAPARHIAICGVSFCGSTLTDLLLEGLPDVASIGESVWLTTNWGNGGAAPRNYSEPHGPGVQQCNYCGFDCPCLTVNFRTALGLNPVDWYFRIANQLKSHVLVSSDKNLPKIVLFDPRLELTGLTIFKSPKQAWASNYTKMAKDLSGDAYWQAMVKYMSVWKNAYNELAHRFRPRRGGVYLDFDRFTEAPENGFRALARALQLQFDPKALTEPSPGHSLGGNSNALKRVKTAGHRADVRPMGEPAIPSAHAAWIDAQEDLSELHGALKTLSSSTVFLDDQALVAAPVALSA